MIRVNLGCGKSKIEGAINVDMSESVKPDIIHDIREPLPFKDAECEIVYFFHCVEHIEKRRQESVFDEIWRILRSGGQLIVSYPEFTEIANNWIKNKFGQREYWEHTIYGRQLYPGDYHVALMDTKEFKELMFRCGFEVKTSFPEPDQPHNTVVYCNKVDKPITYEELVHKEIFI